jgi:diguanylate cyclase (GGDEF)-like protein
MSGLESMQDSMSSPPGDSNALRPFRSLRTRLGLLVMTGIAALAVFLGHQTTQSLSKAYREAGRSELKAIAATMDDGFRGTDMSRPKLLQRRIEKLKANNPNLHKISISWHDRRDNTLLVSTGHEHDPDGAKRDITTNRVRRSVDGSESAPIDDARYGYEEVRAANAHYGELNYPVRRGPGRTLVAALELHYDLKGLDSALAADKRVLTAAAVLAALTIGLVLNLVLGRTVLRPLQDLRRATNRIRSGDRDVRLEWTRSDEIGALAQDFDRMAEELQESRKDPLTGLLNHRAFQERVGEELRRAERERYPLSIVAIDLDGFKGINDRWGHAVGDEALLALGETLRSELRPGDVCGRLGGDEFMLALGRSGAESTVRAVERIRSAATAIRVGPGGECISISAGVAEFPRHSLSQEELLHLADGAMYWAKSTGKNRICIYSSDSDLALSPEEAAERNLKRGLVNTVHALAAAVDAKDGYTHSHSQRVAAYSVALAESMGISGERLEGIRTAGVLHDVGKIGISDTVLLLPRKLTDGEFDEMKRHSELGRDIIAGAGMDDVAEWVLHLHERFDGRGYPIGLRGEQIPLESRILHCADSLEAMTSSRVYRRALPLGVALGEIESNMGTQFDPLVARHLLELVRSGQLAVGEDQGVTSAMPGNRVAALAAG